MSDDRHYDVIVIGDELEKQGLERIKRLRHGPQSRFSDLGMHGKRLLRHSISMHKGRVEVGLPAVHWTVSRMPCGWRRLLAAAAE